MIFVTGSTGFVGAHMLYHLVKAGSEVLALRRPASDINYIKSVFRTYGEDEDTLLDEVNFVEGDVLDYHGLKELDYSIDRIYHLAAMVSFSPRDKEKVLKTNVYGTSNIVNFALEKQIPEIAYVSSVAALDPINEKQRITEEHFGNNPERNSNYAKSKFQSELEIWRGVEEGLQVYVVNPSVILGPGLKADGPGRIFKAIEKGMGFYPTGITGFVDVRDTCRVMMDLVTNNISNERFIVNEGNYSYNKLFNLIASMYQKKFADKELKPSWTKLLYKLDWLKTLFTGKDRLITRELHRSMHHKARFSNEKIRSELKYEFMPIEQTIQDSIENLIE